MRRKLRDFGAPTPWFASFPMTADPRVPARSVSFPCVVKPTRLSGSRGVIRADNGKELKRAFSRIAQMLQQEGADPDQTEIIVEQYLPGVEVAVPILTSAAYAVGTEGEVLTVLGLDLDQENQVRRYSTEDDDEAYDRRRGGARPAFG